MHKTSKERYTENFYKAMKKGDCTIANNFSSSKIIAPLVNSYLQINKIIDFGCGLGIWLNAFISLHKNSGERLLATGIDGDWVPMGQLEISRREFQKVDLNSGFSLDLKQKYDLAICLEVAEHLDKIWADNLVRQLTLASDVVLFSAAIPGQGGEHHVNEQWQSYWIHKFQNKGYICLDIIRPQIWTHKKVMYCYQQNIFMFVNESTLQNYPLLAQAYQKQLFFIPDIVHPHCYQAVPSGSAELDEIWKVWWRASKNLIKRCIKWF